MSSTPYFLSCYNTLCEKYQTCGTRSSVLISLNHRVYGAAATKKIGYILGNTTVTRNILTADIFFIYVSHTLRGNGKGMGLVKAFEQEVIKRSTHVGCSNAIMRITMKSCLESSFDFWMKSGFLGGKHANILFKEISCVICEQ